RFHGRERNAAARPLKDAHEDLVACRRRAPIPHRPPQRLEAASTRAVRLKPYRFQSVKSMLKSGQDKFPLPELVPIPFPVQHENCEAPPLRRLFD
ncbi:MAG: hypothetical protein ACLGRW_09775, partial [Acidobacteriota bacterium]